MTRLAPIAVAVVAALLAVGGAVAARRPAARRAEVVVLLDSPPLARAPGSGAAGSTPSNARSGASSPRSVPSARLGWRYRLVANGYSVTLPRSEQARLRALPGVRDVLPAATYAPRLDSTPQQIGASALWGPSRSTRRARA